MAMADDIPVGILGREARTGPDPETADYLSDLHLDQLIPELLKGREHLDLAALFRQPLGSAADVAFRQDVFRDLERQDLRRAVDGFQAEMAEVARERGREEASRNPHEKAGWMLSAVRRYCDAVSAFDTALREAAPASGGFLALAGWLFGYASDEAFADLRREAEDLAARLAAVRYTVRIDGRSVLVTPGDEGADMGAGVAATFERFGRNTPVVPAAPETESFQPLNHIEAAVLDGVAKGFPDLFGELADFHRRNGEFVAPVLARFSRQVEFYRAVLEAGERLRRAGLSLTYPSVDESRSEVVLEGLYDMALALSGSTAEGIVTNDLTLGRDESIVVVTGPNQGGKSTFARSIGQALHLARLGCPVAGTRAGVPLIRHLLMHFEREDEATAGEGRLAAELRRMKDALSVTDEDTALILNESFSSTSLADARWIGERVIAAIQAKRALAVYVTFIDALANLGGGVVSMMATVDPADPAVRTFHVVRKRADGRAYAHAIARRYRVSREDLSERLRR